MQTPPEPSFIPLAPSVPAAPNERPDSRVMVAPQTARFQPFHALGHNAPVTAPVAAAAIQPRVTLRRENNRITAIVLECSCGQTHELACDYDETTVSGPVPPTSITPPPSTPMAAAAPPAPPAAAPQMSKRKFPTRKLKH